MNWPASFPNAFGNALAIPVRAPGNTGYDGNDWDVKYVAGSGSASGATFVFDRIGTSSGAMYAFNWWAYGY